MDGKIIDVARVVILVVLIPSCVLGHGRLRVPPSRSSMWRDGYSSPANYQDNELFCGGFSYQTALGGKCGVCGDPWNGEKQNEAGGKYANGIITRTYTEGSQIEATVEITAHHKGWFEFSLCPTNNKNIAATEECLQVLPLADGSGTRYMLPTNGAGFYKVTLQLPSDVVCSQCVFRWKYNTGNSWGVGDDGRGCVGCGPQEQFYGCSDISIIDGKQSQNNDTTPKDAAKNATTTTVQTPSTPKQTWTPKPTTKPVDPSQKQCKAAGAYIGQATVDEWCVINCAKGYCPKTHCECSNGEPSGDKTTLSRIMNKVTTTMKPQGSTLKPGPTPAPACQRYAPVGQHTGSKFMEDYCNFVCIEQEGDNCQPAYCKCRTELECVAKTSVNQAPGMDEFCTHLCRNSDEACSNCVCA